MEYLLFQKPLQPLLYVVTLFRKKRFMLDEMTCSKMLNKIAVFLEIEKNLHGFSYTKNMANLEAFRKVISTS